MPKKPQEKNSQASFRNFSSRVKGIDLNTCFIFGAIILVLAVGLFAIFSPAVQDSNAGNPACGKIVIATDGPSLANNVAASLPEARFFLVVDPLSKKLLEANRNPYRSQQPNPQIVYLIAGKGEEAVIVGSIDQQSYNMLMQYGIRVFGGYEGQARKVLSLYRQARISQANVTPMPAPIQAQSLQMSPAVTQAAFTTAGCVFSCPNCAMMANGQAGSGNSCPMCPNCRRQMIQNIAAPPAVEAGWGAHNMAGNLLYNPYCQFPTAQGGALQGSNMNIAYGMPDMNLGMNNMGNFAGMGNQVAFGWGEQPFICPNCNWRLKCNRQGNSFPNCPNCNSPMATDMSNANNGWQWWKNGQQAANMAQLRPQMNQMTNQPNFWQGPESTGFFLCPNCNWRMYAQAGQNEYPRCPNCGQIMARAGAYSQNQNMQNNQQFAGFAGNPNGATQAALQSSVTAPPIPTTAMMPHAYRGVCSNCHQIIPGQVGMQSGQGSTRVVLGQAENR
jgi:predicted Fe-Mo cluster-binding NifX family protein